MRIADGVASISRIPVKRAFFALVLVGIVFIVLLAPQANTARAADVGALIKQLDRTEWEIVSDEVSKRLPNLIATEEEQAALKKMLQSSQKIAALAEALQEPRDYYALQKISTEFLADNLEEAVAVRFGKDSRLYESIQLLKNDRNRELAKRLTHAALNLNPTDARTSIRDYLTEHASERFEKLQAQGEKFWKDMLLEVVPGGKRMASYGFNPVDIYIQQVKDFRDFTAATRLRFNNTALDCLALRYRKLIRDGSSESDAVQMIQDTGTGPAMGSDFKCSEELDKRDGTVGGKSITQQVVDFFTNLGTTTAAAGEMNLSRGEIALLLPLYVKEGAWEKRRDEFSEWLEATLVRRIKSQANGLTDAIDAEQKRVAQKRVSEMDRVMAAIAAEIAELDRDKPDEREETPPRGKEDPVADNADGKVKEDGKATTKDDTKDKDKPEPAKVTAQCERLTALVASSERRVGRASSGETGKLVSDLQAAEAAARGEGNCAASVFASSARVRDRLQKTNALRDRIMAAVRACNVDALPSLKSEAAATAAGAFDNEITLLQTTQSGVSAFNAGKTAFDAGNYPPAKQQLQSAVDAFKELPGGACQSYADRARQGLDTLAKIEVQQARVNRAITSCNVDELKKIRAAYKSRKNRFYREALGRVNAALPDCEKKDRIIAEGKFCEERKGRIDAASADFNANRLKAARQKLVALNKELTASNTRRCSDLPGRVRQGLDNLNVLKTEYERFTRAENACDLDALDVLAAQYRRKKHPWYKAAATRARGVIDRCGESRKQEAEAKFCNQMQRKVDAASDDFMANRLKTARRALNALDTELTASNTRQCSDLPGRVRQGLAQLDALKTEYGRLKQAANNCNVAMLNTLVARYRQKRHPWFRKASSLANDRIEECQDKPPTREEAIADCRRQVANKGKVYATTRFKPDGSYSCHWCEPGQVAQGNVCVPDTQAAEADCRRQAAAKGKVYARTEIRNDGSSICHWCEPGNSYANGKCWTPAQLAEVNCRRDAASRGKVYATVKVFANGQYRCRWCERGFYYANGRCHSRQQAQPRVQPRVVPQPRRRNCGYLPPPCHVDMSGSSAGIRAERKCRARNAQAKRRYRECVRRGR